MNAAHRPKVYFFAQKILKNNTRIFKQASSLVQAGFEVIVIGIQAEGLPSREQKDGYTIVRVSRRPVSLWSLLLGRLSRPASDDTVGFTETTFWERWTGLPQRLRRVLRRAVFRLSRVLNRIKRWADMWLLPPGVQRILQGSSRVIWRSAVKPIELLLRRLITRGLRMVRRSLTRIVRSVRDRGGRAAALAQQRLRSALRWPLASRTYAVQAYGVFQDDPVPPDVVHANDLDTLAVAIRAASCAKAKLVYDAQELYTEVHTLPWLYRALLRWQEFVLIRQADRVIAVNEFIAREMSRRYRIPLPAVVLNCPPFEDLANAAGGLTIRERLGIAQSEPVLLYSGGLTPFRGLENTVLALRHLERGVLVMLGGGKLKERLEALATDAGLHHRIHFVEFIPHTEVPRFISSADVGIVPYEHVGLNHYLCSPSKLFHYLMAELPIAASDFPFLRKVVVGHQVGATFDPSRPASIAAAISSITDDPVRSRQLRDNLRRIKQTYCWETEERKFLSVYGSLGISPQQDAIKRVPSPPLEVSVSGAVQ